MTDRLADDFRTRAEAQGFETVVVGLFLDFFAIEKVSSSEDASLKADPAFLMRAKERAVVFHRIKGRIYYYLGPVDSYQGDWTSFPRELGCVMAPEDAWALACAYLWAAELPRTPRLRWGRSQSGGHELELTDAPSCVPPSVVIS
ncbi:MAG TPA: hypothetical protein VFF73_30940 [Planctomycetota bacterium]|nr:hypothetical protein [Planctomycetota bacterium]